MDDSTIIQVYPSPLTKTNETINISQDSLKIFSEEARATGGQISVSKIKWYQLKFIWDISGIWRLADHSPNLKIYSLECRTPIQQLLPYQAFRILGVWIYPMDLHKNIPSSSGISKHPGRTKSGQATLEGKSHGIIFRK